MHVLNFVTNVHRLRTRIIEAYTQEGSLSDLYLADQREKKVTMTSWRVSSSWPLLPLWYVFFFDLTIDIQIIFFCWPLFSGRLFDGRKWVSRCVLHCSKINQKVSFSKNSPWNACSVFRLELVGTSYRTLGKGSSQVTSQIYFASSWKLDHDPTASMAKGRRGH